MSSLIVNGDGGGARSDSARLTPAGRSSLEDIFVCKGAAKVLDLKTTKRRAACQPRSRPATTTKGGTSMSPRWRSDRAIYSRYKLAMCLSSVVSYAMWINSRNFLYKLKIEGDEVVFSRT